MSWNGDITPTSPYLSTLSPKLHSHSFSSTSPILPTISTFNSPFSTKLPTSARIKTVTSANASVEDFFEDDLWELVDSPILLDSFELSADRITSSVGASSISLDGTVITSNDGSEVGILNHNGGGKIKPRKLQKRSHSGRQV